MVGVAGRSKACGTCKARRIRCTFERPQCSNCIRSNRFCSGYQRERVFFVNVTRHPGTLPKAKTNGKDDQQPPDATDGSDNRDPTREPEKPFWKQKHQQHHHHSKKHPPSQALTHFSPAAHNISTLPTYRQQLFALYLENTVPSTSDFGSGPTTWVHYLALIPHHPPCLASAIDALTLSHLSHLASETTQDFTPDGLGLDQVRLFRQQSLQAYTSGLWHLQRALWSPSEMYEDTTLAACMVLALYELLECPAGNRVGYLAHQNGAARLVQMRGPESYRPPSSKRGGCDGDDGKVVPEGFSHALFVAFRNTGILRALEKHEAGSFLAERAWCTVPWQDEDGTSRKGKNEEIWDYIVLTPDVLARTDVMQRAKPVRSLCIALEVLEYCWETGAELDLWWEGLKESCGGMPYWPVLAGDKDREEGCNDLYPVRFEFLNLRVAITLMSYWSLLVVVFNGMMLLYQVLETVPVDRKAVKALGDPAPAALLRGIAVDCPPDCACGGEPDVPCIIRFDISTMRPLGHRADFMTPLRNICQSVHYCSQPQMKGLGWSSVIVPLSIAIDVIKPYQGLFQRERNWILNVLNSKTTALPYLKNVWWAQNGSLPKLEA